jgi:hypothetical protein
VKTLKVGDDKGVRKSTEDDEAVSNQFSKHSLTGASESPAQVLPEGYHGARRGYPAYAPEPRKENQGIRMPFVCSREGDRGSSYYEDLLMRTQEVFIRSRSVSRASTPTAQTSPVPKWARGQFSSTGIGTGAL